MEKMFTTKELAEKLQMSEGTLKNWRSEGRGIPYIKVGHHVRYKASDVKKYMKKNHQKVKTGKKKWNLIN